MHQEDPFDRTLEIGEVDVMLDLLKKPDSIKSYQTIQCQNLRPLRPYRDEVQLMESIKANVIN
jgi:hypothetical protein